MHQRISKLEEEVAEFKDRSLRFERGYVEARRQFGDKMSDLADIGLKQVEGLRDLTTEVRLVKADVAQIKTTTEETNAEVKAISGLITARFAADDENMGKLMAEFAALHGADAKIQSETKSLSAATATIQGETSSLTAATARLDTKTASLAVKTEKQEEEITKVKELSLEQATRAENERALKTVRTGVATALGGTFLAYVKAHPDAFEKAWHSLLALLGS